MKNEKLVGKWCVYVEVIIDERDGHLALYSDEIGISKVKEMYKEIFILENGICIAMDAKNLVGVFDTEDEADKKRDEAFNAVADISFQFDNLLDEIHDSLNQ